MLTHLTLINFALAEHLAIDIDKGFNVLTGETGAGKSLLLDALSACLGERTDTNYVRYGSEKADVCHAVGDSYARKIGATIEGIFCDKQCSFFDND